MFRKVLFLTVIGLLFAAADLQAVQINSSWIAGDPNAWGNPNNWNPTIVPDNDGNTFAVTINTPESTRVQFNQNRTIDELSCYGDVDLEIGGNYLFLLESNGLTNYGMLEVSGFGVEHKISGNVTNTSGGYIWVGDYLEIHGQFINNGNVTAYPGGNLSVEDGNLVNNGNLIIYNGTVGADNNLENTSSGVIRGMGVIYSGSSPLFQNQGIVHSYGGPLLFGIGGSFLNSGIIGNAPLSSLSIGHNGPPEDVNNQGTIEVNAGGGVAFDCNLVNEPNGVIKLLGGTLAATLITQSADANFAGFGSITGDILIESGAKIELTGPTNIVGDVNIPAGATLEISDGQTLITGHTTCDGTIHLIGGTVIFQGGCDCEDCNIINEAGIDRLHFDINADGIEDFTDFAYFTDTWLWQASWY